AQLNSFLKHTMKHVVDVGLDAMHDNMADAFGGTYPFEVIMGMLLECVKQVKPEIRQFANNYARLFQAMVQPSLSPEAKQKLAAVRAQRAQEQQRRSMVRRDPPPTTTPPWPTGGFDDEG